MSDHTLSDHTLSDHTPSDRDLSDYGSEPNETVEDVVNEALCSDVPRRDFLRRVVRLGVSSAVAYKLLDETTAQAQTGGKPRITTFALGEEGNPPAQSPSPNPPRPNPAQRPTTLAVGEEGSRPTTMAVGEESRPTPTTLAVGEEGNPVTTTKAVGEEQPYCPTPQPTTKAVGEEGRPIKPTPTTLRNGEESTITTHALGEETGGRPTPTTLAVGEEGNPTPQPVPKITTRAVGEEGSNGGPQFKVPSRLYQNIPTPWKNFRRW